MADAELLPLPVIAERWNLTVGQLGSRIKRWNQQHPNLPIKSSIIGGQRCFDIHALRQRVYTVNRSISSGMVNRSISTGIFAAKKREEDEL